MKRSGTALAAIVALMAACGAQAQAPPAGSCHASTSRAVKEARAALDKDETALEKRFRLADALTEQECYDEAVHILEDGEELHPQNAALEAKLRNARSMISEQRYIEGVTRAEEGARLQRNLLRCRKLGDIEACDEALTSRHNDWELLVAKGDALMQQNRLGEALPAYKRAAELNPANAALRTRIAGLEAQRLARATPPVTAPPPQQPPASKPPRDRGSQTQGAILERRARRSDELARVASAGAPLPRADCAASRYRAASARAAR